MSYSPNVTGLKQLLDKGIQEGNITRSVFEAFYDENRFRAFRGKSGKSKGKSSSKTGKTSKESKPSESQKNLDKKSALMKLLNGSYPEVIKPTWKETMSALKETPMLYAEWAVEFIEDGKVNRKQVATVFDHLKLTASEVNATRAFFPKIQQA
jgi:hypothetical protein